MKSSFKTRKEQSYNINSQDKDDGCQEDYCCIKGMVDGKKICDEKMEININPGFFVDYYFNDPSAGICPDTECSCLDDMSGNTGYAIMHTLYALRKRIEELEQKDKPEENAFSMAATVHRSKRGKS